MWRGEWTAAPGKYSRQHLWVLAGAKLKASDSGALLSAAYRDSFRLLLGFAHRQLGKQPNNITLEDLNPTFMLAFLTHLEVDRHNCARSRNARFAAIRSFMEYVSFDQLYDVSIGVTAIRSLHGTTVEFLRRAMKAHAISAKSFVLATEIVDAQG